MRSIVMVAVQAISILVVATGARAGFGDSPTDRDTRWATIEQALFAKASIARDDDLVRIEAPERALDAALVPVTVRLSRPSDVAALYLVIDENPSPVAAHFMFGPDSDPRTITLRVRVNAYTQLHAVAEMKDGRRFMSATYVKASGGCSAPMGVSDEEASKGMGDMKLKLFGEAGDGRSVDARLMIRHPNFNGMQMNETTRDYTPARFIQALDVSFAGRNVFTLTTDISLAANPVIAFAMRPHAAKGPVEVTVADNQGGHWSQTFQVPPIAN